MGWVGRGGGPTSAAVPAPTAMNSDSTPSSGVKCSTSCKRSRVSIRNILIRIMAGKKNLVCLGREPALERYIGTRHEPFFANHPLIGLAVLNDPKRVKGGRLFE